MDKERRAGEAEARSRDVRLQRALEEVEKYKAMLADVRTQVMDVIMGSEPRHSCQVKEDIWIRMPHMIVHCVSYMTWTHSSESLLPSFPQEKEGARDVTRAEHNRILAENKRLERQRAELVVAFKKQLKLIDVLKRQRLHLEASRALQFTEQEFLQTLDMGSS